MMNIKSYRKRDKEEKVRRDEKGLSFFFIYFFFLLIYIYIINKEEIYIVLYKYKKSKM